MKFLSRVVWSEGMYLAPQHFQTQSRYFEDSIASFAQSLWREPWGLLQLELDKQAITNGRAAILHAGGFFPDGLPFDMPASDRAPESRELAALFPITASELRLFLAVPARNNDGYDASHETRPAPGTLRYQRRTYTFRDETNGIDEQEVELAQKNIQILAAGELTPGVLAIPLARVIRDARGRMMYDDEFVPSCLRISASRALVRRLQRIIEAIGEKSTTITRGARGVKATQGIPSPGFFEPSTSPLDIASYWFLHSLHSSLPVLRHMVQTLHAHPSDCFMELARLAGALCTFAVDSDPRTLPLYDHRDPGPGFEALCAHIRTHLEIMVPSNTVSFVFSPAGPYLYEAQVPDERTLRRARWVLGMRSSLGESEMLRAVPRLVKICSARFVLELVKRALPGMELTHLPVPPNALRIEPDMHYFALDIAGPCWEHILHTRSVGVYIPGEIAQAEFTLTAILESQP